MDKNIITFQANEQELINTTPEVFASDTVSYIEAHFELGQNWSGFDSVRAIWSNGYERISTVLDSLGVCIVPTEVLTRRADVLMNLVGSISDNGELTDRLTTFPVVALRVTKKAMVEGTETAPITPSQFEQFASAVRQDADRAEAGASEAEGYRDEALQIKTDVQGLKADVEGLKSDTEQLKDDTASIKADVQAIADGFDDTVADAVQDITELAETKEGEITSLGDDKKAEISSLANDKKAEITAEGTTQKGLVTAEGTSQLSSIRTEGSSQLSAIRTEGTTQKGIVTTEGQTQVGNVQTEGQTQVSAIQTEGAEQIQAIEDKGQEVISLIPYMAPVIVDTASGDIASFTDGADDYPIKSLKVELEPIQDLNGQEYPYPSGGGVNKWDEQTELGALGQNGTKVVKVASSTELRTKNAIEVQPNTSYCVVANNYTDNIFIGLIDDLSTMNGSLIARKSGVQFTTGAATHYILFALGSSYGTTYKNNVSLNYPSTDTTYHPYSNICPISGWDEVEVEHTGVNLFDKTDSTNILNNAYINNGEVLQGTGRKIIYLPCKPNTTYTAQKIRYETATRFAFAYSDSVPIIGGSVYGTVSGGNSGTVGAICSATLTTGADAKYLVLWASWTSSIWSQELDSIQIEVGSTATDYEPYQGSTYPISLPSTVYGGTPDVVSGKLVIDKAYALFDGSDDEDWRKFSSESASAFCMSIVVNGLLPKDAYGIHAISDYLKPITGASTWGNYDYFIATTSGMNAIYTGIQSITTVDAWKTYLASHPLTVIYELAEPITIQLTPTEIKSLFGSNNIWSNGEVEVEYCADTKLYIDKKLASI